MRHQAHHASDPRTAELAVLLGGVPSGMREGEDGRPRYEGTDVVVPGGVPVALAETLDVLEVRTKTGELRAVQVPEHLVEDVARLAWVRTLGRLLRPTDGTEGFYAVDAAVWEEHAAATVAVKAPEHEPGLRGRLASEERDVRFARRVVELRTELRSRLVMLASGLGMSRRETSALIALTPGRVQQLIDDAPEALKLEVADFLDDVVVVLQDLGRRTVGRDALSLPAGRGPEFLEELIALGLLAEDEAGVRRTDFGDDAELHLRADRKQGRRRSS